MIKVKWSLMHGGHCTHPEKLILPNRPWKTRVFPALFSLIEHPKYGLILFDTGYTSAFFSETQKLPYRLYRYVTPVTFYEEQSAIHQVKRLGYSPHDVQFIILSHLHADHICGVRDFPTATFILTRAAYEEIAHTRGLKALQKGFIPSLLPSNFLHQVDWLDEKLKIELDQQYSPFTYGYDLFHDQSLVAVDLPGHAAGQIGLFFHTIENESVFLLSDGCWTCETYQHKQFPHPLTQLITHNSIAYRSTLKQIYQFAKKHPQVRMIPSHCIKTWKIIQAERKK